MQVAQDGAKPGSPTCVPPQGGKLGYEAGKVVKNVEVAEGGTVLIVDSVALTTWQLTNGYRQLATYN